MVLFLVRAGLAEELHFSNSSAWILSFGDKWTVKYFPHPSVSPDLQEAPVKFANNKFECEIKDGPVESVMLFNRDIYVCHLRKGEKGGWLVPKLSNVTFDLGKLEGMADGEYITFDAKDPISAFYLDLESGKKVERLIDQGLIFEFYTVRGTKVGETKGVILVSDSSQGLVKLVGNIKGKWSLTLDWSP